MLPARLLGLAVSRDHHTRGRRLRVDEPKRGECTNLLVPWSLAATHIAFGSIRMEPVFMVLAHSAATAAAIAIDRGVSVQNVPYAELRDRLLKDGQVLEYAPPAK